jgi:hypothetical protein
MGIVYNINAYYYEMSVIGDLKGSTVHEKKFCAHG